MTAIYPWPFGDEALLVTGTEMGVEAGLVSLENPVCARCACRIRRPARWCSPRARRSWSTARPTIGVLEAAERRAERQAAWHGRLNRALRPYGDNSASVGAAADLGIDADGRSFHDLAERVVAAAEANGRAHAGEVDEPEHLGGDR